MIAIRLLGGAKKAVGKPTFSLDRQHASVSEILKFLQDISVEPQLLQRNNLIVAVNGIDSAALQGGNTVAKDGDTVTIVTVVHGGTLDNHTLVAGVLEVNEAGGLVDRLRSQNPGVSIQAANADAVYGIDHALGALGMALEAEKREIMLANKCETEVLMRLACTGQISEAINRAGLKKNEAGCFIAFSQDEMALQRFAIHIKENFKVDDLVLRPSAQKKVRLSRVLGITDMVDENEFLQYLLERAAILVK